MLSLKHKIRAYLEEKFFFKICSIITTIVISFVLYIIGPELRRYFTTPKIIYDVRRDINNFNAHHKMVNKMLDVICICNKGETVKSRYYNEKISNSYISQMFFFDKSTSFEHDLQKTFSIGDLNYVSTFMHIGYCKLNKSHDPYYDNMIWIFYDKNLYSNLYQREWIWTTTESLLFQNKNPEHIFVIDIKYEAFHNTSYISHIYIDNNLIKNDIPNIYELLRSLHVDLEKIYLKVEYHNGYPIWFLIIGHVKESASDCHNRQKDLLLEISDYAKVVYDLK